MGSSPIFSSLLVAKSSACAHRAGSGELNPSARSRPALWKTHRGFQSSHYPVHHASKRLGAYSHAPLPAFVPVDESCTFSLNTSCLSLRIRNRYGTEISYIDQISVSNLGLVGREAQDLQQIGTKGTISLRFIFLLTAPPQDWLPQSGA